MNILQSVASVLAVPFKWGYEIVDTHPPGSAYRHVAAQLHAVDTAPGEVVFVVGHGLTAQQPVVAVIKAETPAEAANATLGIVSALRRSQARGINQAHKKIVAVARASAQSEPVGEGPVGNAGLGSPGNPIPGNSSCGVAGNPCLMPA